MNIFSEISFQKYMCECAYITLLIRGLDIHALCSCFAHSKISSMSFCVDKSKITLSFLMAMQYSTIWMYHFFYIILKYTLHDGYRHFYFSTPQQIFTEHLLRASYYSLSTRDTVMNKTGKFPGQILLGETDRMQVKSRYFEGRMSAKKK